MSYDFDTLEYKVSEISKHFDKLEKLLKRKNTYIKALKANARYFDAILAEVNHGYIAELCRDALKELAMLKQEYEKDDNNV